MFKELHMFVGEMYSGKSTNLMLEYKKCKTTKAYVKFSLDLVQEPKAWDIETHAGMGIQGWKANTFEQILPMVQDIDTLFLDEIFFVSDWSNWRYLVKDKVVYVATLDMDYKYRPFSQVGELMCVATSVEKIHGKCRKGNQTVYTHALEEPKGRYSEQDHSKIEWMPICRECGYSGNINPDCLNSHLKKNS